MTRRRSLLRPRPGRRVPPELRVENVGHLASRLAGGVRDPALIDLLSTIDDDAPIHHGDAITIFTRGADAFAAMREAIETARWEVLLESYIFRDDETGRAIYDSLRHAADRGATVRVLADGWGSLTTGADFWARLEQAGIRVRLFHPLLRQPWFHPFRDHRKILVVDRRVAFTGGMNIGNEYRGSGSGPGSSFGSERTGRSPEKNQWRDTHCRVVGPTAREMALVFSEGWRGAGGRNLAVDSGAPSTAGAEGRVLVLESRPGRGHEESASVLAALVGAARRRVWITNGYFAPRGRAVKVLAAAVERGVDVRLLLPGVTDVAIVRHAGHGWFEELLTAGVRIWEYQPAVLHAKSMVVDGHAAVVGSTNLDFRSFRLNAECNLVMLSDTTGHALEQAFQEDLGDARPVDLDAWRRRSRAHRLGDRLARWLSPLL